MNKDNTVEVKKENLSMKFMIHMNGYTGECLDKSQILVKLQCNEKFKKSLTHKRMTLMKLF